MYIRSTALTFLALATSISAFVGNVPFAQTSSKLHMSEIEIAELDESMAADIRRAVKYDYKAGAADTEFADKYRHLVGSKIKTVGEAFAEFTKELGYTVNPLYKNMVTDMVGTTHLITVNARFQRDPIWSLGIMTALELLLNNYPEPEVGQKIVSSLFKSIGVDEAEVRAEAKSVQDWAQGKSQAEIESALEGVGDSPVADAARNIKTTSFWMYSRYFGIGLLKLMEDAGIEMDKDAVYPIMEDWMGNKLGVSYMTACSDSDLFFKVKQKLDMMETMMKEIEIREKKRMAERLEEKAEAALRAADRESKMQDEIAAEAAKNRDRVESS